MNISIMPIKAKKIERIEVDEEEDVFDIEVQSKNHNFTLFDGINGVFVHNSLKVPKQYFGCLRGNTPILLLNGQTISVEEMYNNKEEYIGKGIMACNTDGTLCPTVITNIMLTKYAPFIRLHFDNGEYVDVTDDHRMMMRDGAFKYAKDVEVEDVLMPNFDRDVLPWDDGQKVILIEYIDVNEPAYDISVQADCHTFALPCGIFVHNCTDDSTGFNGGTSLTIISARYAKTILNGQNIMIQAITDAINNIMYLDPRNKKMKDKVNHFTLHMVSPTTQSDIDRATNLDSRIRQTSDIMGLVSEIDDPILKMKILKSSMSSYINQPEIIDSIQEYIDRLEADKAEQEKAEANMENNENEFGGETSYEEPSYEEPAYEEEPSYEEEETGGEEEAPEEEEGEAFPLEAFNDSEGKEVLNEEGAEEETLPTPEELGIDFTDPDNFD